ncbi:MAG TPA: cytochrome c [Blastocatellia bacterium]|nr:cytochrome c [Blastocatellia bacterium]
MNTQTRLKLQSLSAALAVVLCALLSGAGASRGSATTSPSAAEDGAGLFGQKCALCHGKDGAGLPNWKAKGQPDFTNSEWQGSHADSQIADSVRNGKGKFMPAFKAKLSDEQIGALVQRVRAFGKKK